jgi:hypothetical protein
VDWLLAEGATRGGAAERGWPAASRGSYPICTPVLF